jgi:hypothetical protein
VLLNESDWINYHLYRQTDLLQLKNCLLCDKMISSSTSCLSFLLHLLILQDELRGEEESLNHSLYEHHRCSHRQRLQSFAYETVFFSSFFGLSDPYTSTLIALTSNHTSSTHHSRRSSGLLVEQDRSTAVAVDCGSAKFLELVIQPLPPSLIIFLVGLFNK